MSLSIYDSSYNFVLTLCKRQKAEIWTTFSPNPTVYSWVVSPQYIARYRVISCRIFVIVFTYIRHWLFGTISGTGREEIKKEESLFSPEQSLSLHIPYESITYTGIMCEYRALLKSYYPWLQYTTSTATTSNQRVLLTCFTWEASNNQLYSSSKGCFDIKIVEPENCQTKKVNSSKHSALPVYLPSR